MLTVRGIFMNIKNKIKCCRPVVLVTGSSRGIGFAIAKKMANAGYSIVLNGKKSSSVLDDAADDLRSKGTQVLVLPFDISDITTHADILEKIIDTFGRIDTLINNAGVSVKVRGDLLDVSPESFDQQISVNLRSHFFLTQTIAKWMVNNSSTSFRSIINISSSNAEAAAIERGEYSIAKSGVSMMTKLFALRLARDGINVCEVKPGLIATDMTAVAKDKYDHLIKEGFSPINRWGKPDDVAKVVSTLAIGEWPFVTGESIHIDGGLLIPTY